MLGYAFLVLVGLLVTPAGTAHRLTTAQVGRALASIVAAGVHAIVLGARTLQRTVNHGTSPQLEHSVGTRG